MSSYDIQGMRNQGMNDRQISRYIKKAERDRRRQLSKPRKLLPGASVDQVKSADMNLGSSSSLEETNQILKNFKPDTGYGGPPQSVLQGRMAKPSPTFVGAMKKGGGAKNYEKGGKINLDACSVSTASKSKKSPNW